MSLADLRDDPGLLRRPKEWVVGFLYNPDGSRVVLIRKNRPEWQAGRLNGVGGRVEPGEAPAEAMRREFAEETGLDTSALGWKWDHFATLLWEEGMIWFHRAFARQETLDSCRSTTDELVEQHWVHQLAAPTIHPAVGPVTPNLLWLVPLGAHRHDVYEPVWVVEKATLQRKAGRGG